MQPCKGSETSLRNWTQASPFKDWLLTTIRWLTNSPAICHSEYSLNSVQFSVPHTWGEGRGSKHPLHLLNLGPLPGFLQGSKAFSHRVLKIQRRWRQRHLWEIFPGYVFISSVYFWKMLGTRVYYLLSNYLNRTWLQKLALQPHPTLSLLKAFLTPGKCQAQSTSLSMGISMQCVYIGPRNAFWVVE